MIIKKKNKKADEGELEQAVVNDEDQSEVIEEQEIDLFDLDNIDFKQRQERRKGDRRRGFRRIDDRNLISRAKEEANMIKEAAAKEGYDAGLEAAKFDIENIKASIAEFMNAKQAVYETIAPDILEIGLEIAKKIIKREMSEDPQILLENIKDIMKGLSKDETKITLKVSPSQVAMVKQDVPEVAESLGVEAKIIVVADETVMEGGCVVTTTNGVIDATVESQLAIISEVLKEV